MARCRSHEVGPGEQAPDVVLATHPDRVDEASWLARAWGASVDGLWIGPIEASGEIVLGVAASTGDRALDPIVVCGMGYEADEIDAATAPAVDRLRHDEAAWRGGPPLDLARTVVAVVDGPDALSAVAAGLAAHRRGARRLLLVDVSDDDARAAGFDDAAPPVDDAPHDRGP